MGFYEYDRVRSKQNRYLTNEAERMIQQMRDSGLKTEQIIASLEAIAENKSPIMENAREIAKKALQLVQKEE